MTFIKVIPYKRQQTGHPRTLTTSDYTRLFS